MTLDRIKALRDEQKAKQSPGQHIGNMLLAASNSPEYLASQLTAYQEAAMADYEADCLRTGSLIRSMQSQDKLRELQGELDEELSHAMGEFEEDLAEAGAALTLEHFHEYVEAARRDAEKLVEALKKLEG